MKKPSYGVFSLAEVIESLSYLHTIEYTEGLADYLGMEAAIVAEAMANHACAVTIAYHAPQTKED